MTRVDFYLLSDEDRAALARFACRVALKGMHQGQLVHIHAQDEAGAMALDELLWDYPEQRFLPHQLLREGDRATAPVTVGCTAPNDRHGLLINTVDEVPAFFARFDRIAEIVVGQTRESGRGRYKHYRDRGYPLHHHELDEWEA